MSVEIVTTALAFVLVNLWVMAVYGISSFGILYAYHLVRQSNKLTFSKPRLVVVVVVAFIGQLGTIFYAQMFLAFPAGIVALISSYTLLAMIVLAAVALFYAAFVFKDKKKTIIVG